MESLGCTAHCVLCASAYSVRLRLEQVAFGCCMDNGKEGLKSGRWSWGQGEQGEGEVDLGDLRHNL